MNKRISIVEVTSFKKLPTVDKNKQLIAILCILLLFVISFLLLIKSGFTLTVVEGAEYAKISNNNTLGSEPLWGERGIILDRNGKPLVSNVKVYDIYVNPQVVAHETSKQLLGDIQALSDIYKDPQYVDYLVIHDAPKEQVVALKENLTEGIKVRYNYSRQYLYPEYYAHVLGYTGIASQEDMEENSSIIRNQVVGKSGLEYQYEKELQGELTYLTYERDAYGNEVSSSYSEPPAQGKNLVLTIDGNMQKAFYDVLQASVSKNKAKGAAGVVLNISTGEVLALVSYPSYNPNLFVKGISYADYNKLIQSPQTPLLHRAIAAQEPPGSTYKTIVAAGALAEGAITPSTTVYASGIIRLAGGFPFQDYRQRVYGTLTVRDALMVSSNIFFCKSALALGIDKFVLYSEKFGIGQKTGIDLPGEMSGRVPSPENKLALYKAGATWLDDVWYPEGDTCNSAIGQGITLATPLQMANVAAAIANDGIRYKPHLVKTISNSTSIYERTSEVTEDSIASHDTFQVIREGMRMSVDNARGVATALRYVPVEVAAKTGTAEFGIKDKHGYSTAHGWVIGFWPYDKPEYAFAVLVEGAGSSSVATFAMRDFLNKVY